MLALENEGNNMEALHFDFFKADLIKKIIPEQYILMPNVNDIFELEFALGEIACLTKVEIIKRSAFVGKLEGQETDHFRIGMASSLDIYNGKSIRTRSFFAKGRFSTGYGVHSLFPYRGKFHAQMVKGIMNVIGLKPGDLLLDPMMGSGTACIEAQSIGIDAVGFDISPFCVLMASAKSRAMFSKTDILCRALANVIRAEEFLTKNRGVLLSDEFLNTDRAILALAYLDAMGYARRVASKDVTDKFPEVLSRYEHTINLFQSLKKELGLTIGSSRFEVADARQLPLENSTVDGIITSPPYSFAIDYIENDLPQLEFMGYDVTQLRESLIGLRGGKKKADRIQAYLEDLKMVLQEMSRVLKPHKFSVIVIGSNEIQTGGIRFEKYLKEIAPEFGFQLEREMIKPIRGIQNSMADEYVLFLRKTP